jgi:phytoene dehydrogenase-like protein
VLELTADAVVIGAGPNGLVAANLLADAGWDVALLEAAEHVGGAVASVERTPGYVSDLFSAFYPLAAVSPIIGRLDLPAYGLRWRRAPVVLAHPAGPTSRPAAVLHPDPERTAAALDGDARGDGETWLRLVRQWQVVRDSLLRCLFTPFPPVRGGLGLLADVGTPETLRLARTLVLPVHRLGEELFRGQLGRLLLAGNAMHADVPSVAPGSGAFGWILSMLAQDVGYPVPAGGAGMLAEAMARRAEAAGVRISTGSRVVRVEVAAGRATGVLTEDGRRYRARRAVLADLAAPTLFRDLLPVGAVPARMLAELDRCFAWDLPTVKVNWALSGKVPWRDPDLAGAGTVHLGADVDQLALWSAALSSGQPSEHVFQLIGQMATADPTRAPDGAESLWAYSHLPLGCTDQEQARDLARRMQQGIEEHAPGFSELVVDRWEQTPQDLQAGDANLVHGSVNGGTAQLFQQLVFRPVSGLGRPETPVAGLYLAGAASSPGGGVHGACGSNAARAALTDARLRGLPGRLLVGATRRLGR